MYDVLPGWGPSQHRDRQLVARMISARSLDPSGFSPFAAGIRGHASIPASRGSRRLANLTRYNTGDGAEFRRTGAPVARERWNMSR